MDPFSFQIVVCMGGLCGKKVGIGYSKSRLIIPGKGRIRKGRGEGKRNKIFKY